jgi:uracil-DNA glycosylase family 4
LPNKTSPDLQITPSDTRKHPLAKCEECPLAGRVGRYVPSEFPTTDDGRARLAFLGEAPGRTEVSKQRPFVGPSGQLLERVLEHYNIERGDVLLTNAASCRYPDSLAELPISAIEACRPRLEAELSQCGIETIVAMGNSAIKGVARPEDTKQGVTKFRSGPPKESRWPNIKLVPTFHPAACLRSHGNFPHMVADTGKAVAYDPPQQWYEPDIKVITSISDANDIVNEITQLNRGQGVVVDTESSNDKDNSYGNTHLANLLCVGVGPLDPSNYHTVYVFPQDLFQFDYFRKHFSEMLIQCGVVAHNGKYDLAVINSALSPENNLPLIFDTMLAHYALDERGGIHGLKYLATEYLGTPDYESEIKPYIKSGNYGTIPPNILHKYNGYDVHATRLLYSYLSDQIETRGLTTINTHLIRVSQMLMGVESRGIGFDMEYSQSLGERLSTEQEEVEATIPFNPRSPKQVLGYFSEFKIRLPNTREETLVYLVSKLADGSITKTMVERILRARGYTKMLSTYVTGLQEKVVPQSGTIHPSFLLHGTTTGRLSSRNPNAQNIPRAKELKRQFIPSQPGNVFIQCDYSQAELRTLTWLAHEEGMRDLFNDPTKDIFVELCRDMFPQWDEWDEVQKKEIRTLVKTFAYGVSYGRTAEGIASDPAFNMNVQQAAAHMKRFQEMIPGIMRFQKEVIARVHRGEDLINPFGRHRRFSLITEQNRTAVDNEAMAYLPQSTASDICLEAACRLSQQAISIRNLVHDSILVESKPDEAGQILALMTKTMKQVAAEVVDGYVDFDADGEIGHNWADLKKVTI